MGREKVTFDSENKAGKCEGVLQGDFSQTKKGLIVLQEWLGYTKQIQNEAEEIGNLGKFITLVPDLYRGKLATDNEEAGHLMNNLEFGPAPLPISGGAAKFLLSKGCTSVGVTGFCMGGALAMASAALGVRDLRRQQPFYGIPGASLADVSKIKIPVQGHFGEKDELEGFSSPKDVKALEEKFKSGGVQYELFNYPAGHAFTTPQVPNYNADCCKTAFGRLVEFMNKNLK
ncbi:LOW QUALITY PROTEIN: protein usf-like [Liolophura sinensis]|uniref:LOW QUALITY PROTEIN: protein usf-like n=1 Tax=Liolophura sinensis TaxID=3198878 RepID=UPI003158164E